MVRKNRLFAKLASDVDISGNLAASGIQSEALDTGVTVYAARANLPSSGNTAGDQAYVTGNNRLYIWNGSGWYNIALLNVAPSISSVLDSDGGTTPFILATDGTATTITITAQDSDGDPITYSATADSDFGGLATLSQADNVFTITPFSSDSATTTSGTITFTATDGINVASSGIQTFTLNFVSALWDETVLSIGTSSTNSLANSTFVDRSTNASTVTAAGSPVQTAFHPYLDNWSVEFDGSGDYSTLSETPTNLLPGTSDATIEVWVNTVSSGDMAIFSNFNSSSPYNGVEFGVNNGYQTFWSQGTWLNRPANLGVSTINDGQWHHLAWVITNSGTTLTTYVDGVQNYTSSITASTTGNATQSIGSDSNATRGRYFNGHITNLRFVKGTAVYTSAFTPPTEKLTAITNTVLLTCQSNRFIDNSTNSYTITPAGNTKISAFNPFGQESEYTPGENKGSTKFNKSNYLTYPQDNTFIFGTDDVTIEAWVYPIGVQGDQYTTRGMIYGKATGSGANWFNEIFSVTNSDLQMHTNNVNGNSSYSIISATNALIQQQWNHVAFTQRTTDSTRYWSLYSNGARVAHTSTSYDLSVSSTGWTHHTGYYPGNAISYDYNGYISDLRITKGSAVYSDASYTIPTTALGNTSASIYLPMDNAGIYDKSGNHTLTLVGDTSTSTTQTKYADTSMYFDGTGDWITFDEQVLGSTDFTVEGWVYLSSLKDYQILFDNRATGTSTTGFAFGVTSTGAPYLYTSSAFQITSTETISATTWAHIALTRSGSTMTIWVNGTSGGTYTSTANFSDTNCGIGIARTYTPTSQFSGYMENVQILNGVAKYTSNFTPPTQTQGRTYQAES